MKKKYENGIEYINDCLCWNKKSITSVIDTNKTPFYLYSLEQLKNNFVKFKDAALSEELNNILVCFALKANPNPNILKTLKELGAGADIVSGGELKRALEVGISPEKIVFSGVGKTEEEIDYALSVSENGIYSFNIESVEELKLINVIAKNQNKKARVAFRLNPLIKAKTHRYISTGDKAHKFGILEEDILKICNNISNYSHIQVVGLSIHIGSQLTDLLETSKAICSLASLLKKINLPLEFLDVGGGLGVNYHHNDNSVVPTARDYMNIIKRSLNEELTQERLKSLKIIFEPGRVISASAGIFVTKVIRTKKSLDRHFTIVDGGMNDFVRTSLYEAYHEILPINIKIGSKIKTDIVGPICESSDYFATQRSFQKIDSGDHLVVLDTGAYGHSMSSQYNLRSRPEEVILED